MKIKGKSTLSLEKVANNTLVLSTTQHEYKFCILTLVQNEDFFLPIWLSYYTKIFSKDDVYVINNNGDDMSFEQAQKNFEFQPLELKTQYNQDLHSAYQFVEDTIKQLLTKYSGVFLAESDEILFHPNGLKDAAYFYLDLPITAIRCCAYDIFHDHLHNEPNIDINKPLLKQRKFWFESPHMRKPVFTKEPIVYKECLHNFDEIYTIADYQLTLIHLKLIDYYKLLERNNKTLQRGNFSPISVEERIGWQNRLDKDEFDRMFNDKLNQLREIPEKYLSII